MAESYASLGYNCEAAFQFRRATGGDVSSYFNWCFSTPKSVIDLIQSEFAEPVHPARIWPSGIMIWESRYDISYHGDVFHKSDEGRDRAAFNEQFEIMTSKLDAFVRKWIWLTASSTRLTYFLKLRQDERAIGAPRDAAVKVRDALRRAYPRHLFRIVAIMSLEHGPAEDQWDEPQIYNRYFDRFAPDDVPENGDAVAWDRLFNEFPLVHDVVR